MPNSYEYETEPAERQERLPVDSQLLSALLNGVDKPMMLVGGALPVMMNRKCELLTGFNGRQLSYLHKLGRFYLRRSALSPQSGYHLYIQESDFHFLGTAVGPAGGDCLLLEIAPPQASAPASRAASFAALIGQSAAFLNTVTACRQAEAAHLPVLLSGESGTGKEALARAMHQEGPYPEKNFICIHNHAEFTASPLLQTAEVSEAIRQLQNHTLYIDEVANLNHYNQDRLFFLLRASQAGAFKAICATSADLKKLLMRGEWHHNLYELLTVLEIKVPPLRQRKEDIPLFAQYYLNRINRQTGRALRLGREMRTEMCRYEWPGNLYELESFMMETVRTSRAVDGELDAPLLTAYKNNRFSSMGSQMYNLGTAEKAMIIRALNDFSGAKSSKKIAAQALGISLTTLYRKMEQYDIHEDNLYDG